MDYHSKQLINLKSKGQSAASEISEVIIGWKNTFSFYWYHQYINDDQKKLDFVFALLFELTEFPDSNVTIASFNAIGALLVSLSPFRSQELILSFKNTLSSLEVSPSTSCAVIATFVFLSHHVSDNSISHFIDSTPIFPHFGADLRMFIHHIPNLIEQMDRLNMEFHQALLRSLISSFGRSPVSSFIESVMLLLKRFPNKLLSDLMEFIESNKLEDTLLSVGGPILNNPTFSELLSIQQKYTFLNTLKRKLFIPKSKNTSESDGNATITSFDFNESDYEIQTEVTATELEQTISIISGLKKQSEEELKIAVDKMADAIWNQRNKLKSVFQRILFPLAKTVDELRPKKDDSSNEMSKKIMALSNLENTNDDEILAICEPFIDIRDECFISVMSFLSKSMKEKCYKLVKKLFEKDDYSWVQRIAILNLIDNLDQFKMEAYMNDYNHKCIGFLVKCSLSLQTELANQSRQVISRFVSLNNVEIFRDSILKCDFFNLQITKNILQLLNVIVNSISPSPMRCFIGIVLELFDFTLSDIVNADSDDLAFESINIYPSFVADCFEFLSHYPGLFPYRKSIERICICKMQEVYYSFTQEKLFSQAQLDNTAQSTTSSSKKNASASQMTKILKNNVRPILSTITTDVVADASLVRYEFLEPLKNCLQYLAANQVQTTIYRPTFLKLLPIFPKEILPYFYDHSMIIANCNENNTESFLSANEIEMIKPKILRIFSSNRHQVVIARCCEFFYQSKIINQGILIQVKKIFETTRIKSSNSAFEFFKLIYTVEPESAITYLKKLLNIPVDNNFEIIPLNDLTKNELALLASNIPSVHKILSEMEEFSFLQYKTNRFAAKAWFEHNDYSTWPLIEPDLLEDIKKMFNKTYSVHIKDCSLVDNHHWNFLMKNKSLFYKETIKSYSDSNRSSLKAICVFNTNPLEKKRNHFNFSESIQKDIIDNLDESAKLLPSTSLLIKKGRFVNNEILVKNFLMFSNIQASPYLLNEMKEAFPNLSSNFNEYEGRFAKKPKNKNPIFVNKEFVKKVESHNKEEKKSLGLQIIAAQDEPIIIEEEEDQENKDDEKVWADEENKDEIQFEQEEETTEDSREEQKEESKEENIEEAKEENNDENNEEQKEENKEEENKVENKEEGKEENEKEKQKEENMEEAKEENKVENKEEQKDETKEEGKEENKVETKEENEKEEQKEENKEEQKEEENKVENREEQKEEGKEENKEEQKEEENKVENREEQKEEGKEENKDEIKVENEKEENKEEQKEDNKEEDKGENKVETKEENEKEEQKEENKEEQKEEIKLEFNEGNIEESKEIPKSEDTIKLHQEQQPKLPPFPIRNEKANTKPKPVPVPVDPSILSFDPNFPIKSKFIKSLCLLPPKNTVLISMYRMHLINRINEIRSPKQFFYFLRFLRINLVIFKNSREALAIRQNTIENYFPIINKLRILASGKKSSNDQDFDYFQDEKDLSFVLLEFAKLSSKLYTIQELARIHKNVLIPGKTDSIDLLLISNLIIHSSKFRNMTHSVFSLSNGILNSYSIHQLKSSNLSRIPSFLSFIITTIKMLPNEESCMFFTRHFKTMFEDDIVADMAIDYLSFYLQKASIIAGEKSYVDFFDGNILTQMALILFDTKSSLFKKSGEKKLLQILFSNMKGQFKNNLIQFLPLIEKLPVCGYSLPFVIDLVNGYFNSVAWNVFMIPLNDEQEEFLESYEKQQQKKGKQRGFNEQMRKQNLFNFNKEFGIKEVRIVQSIYQVCPSIINAIKLGKTLITAASFFDSLALIFGKFAPFEDGAFLGIFCIAAMFYFEFINDNEKRRRFTNLVQSFEQQNLTFKSRYKALNLIAQEVENFEAENLEAAFAIACLETNDDEKIEEVMNLFSY